MTFSVQLLVFIEYISLPVIKNLFNENAMHLYYAQSIKPLRFKERLSHIYEQEQEDGFYLPSDLDDPYADQDEDIFAGTNLTKEQLEKFESATYLPQLT